jgi:hypothetical protein
MMHVAMKSLATISSDEIPRSERVLTLKDQLPSAKMATTNAMGTRAPVNIAARVNGAVLSLVTMVE